MARQSHAVHETQKPPTPSPENASRHSFSKFAARIANASGSSIAFGLACLGVIIWASIGHVFHYSDTWQLVINTATTIITFLMVFLIQNTQNRDTRAMNLKLDEIIRSMNHAHNELIDIEHLSDDELQELSEHYKRIREECDHRQAARALTEAKRRHDDAA